MSLAEGNTISISKERFLFLVLLFQVHKSSFYCLFFNTNSVIVKIRKWKLNTIDPLKGLIQIHSFECYI